ncbi:PDDEXK nuclease domain-containing protein [Thiomicrospira microaerophila]|uniref:PDDEXK nuclease domain-containing protein n=1 Tax=Thiomicrospira microaerophila TaxID=406020 RepID=UPI0005CA1602|nr:PDDEXK nuclease domain-containing protein [Thiomicrospira microaerophila]
MSLQDNAYQTLIQQVSQTYLNGQTQALQAVNYQLIETYWCIGQHLVEFEQKGQQRAQYGQALLKQLAQDLTLRHGKGFSRSNLIRMRQFYLAYPISAKPSHKLSWSHYVELLKLDDPQERGFYQQQAIAENWSVPELKRQKQAQLFLRLAASKDKAGLLCLAQLGQVVTQPTDLLREPYIFEFLKIPEAHQISETQLETALCDHLQPFLLELGKGFTFVGRQYRITLNNRHYKVDLVFYHRILRCFVLIDLKLGEVQHQDIGQKYQLYLPDRESLQRELELALAQTQAGEE